MSGGLAAVANKEVGDDDDDDENPICQSVCLLSANSTKGSSFSARKGKAAQKIIRPMGSISNLYGVSGNWKSGKYLYAGSILLGRRFYGCNQETILQQYPHHPLSFFPSC